MRETRLALLLACLPLLGCDAFGDVERPGESSGGAGNAGGAASASAGKSGAGANGHSTGSVFVGVGGAGSCQFGDQAKDCASCVEALCCLAVGPARQQEPVAVDALAACLDGIGCSCVNDQNVCFSEYDDEIAPTSAAAVALPGCIRGACALQCDCCLDN